MYFGNDVLSIESLSLCVQNNSLKTVCFLENDIIPPRIEGIN